MLFGTKRLRTMGGDLGSAVKGFRKSMAADDEPADTSNEKKESSSELDKDK
ncbi:UNVERIFIED_CONTAM: hypothetical protein GTU68_058457 [Idotea baltica]|nr:hypothetical protein [Idotea baltica]